ncbi:MAG: acetate/propionate family kinase [Pseudomonadota bacterium]
MLILVMNGGSSSLKYTLFEMDHETVLFSGEIDRVGLAGSRHVFRSAGRPDFVRDVPIKDQGEAMDEALATLTADGPLASLVDEIKAVAHRVGHGGRYRDAVRVDSDVIDEIRRMTPMIPLHHPAMIQEILECRERMPHAKHIAVFDTWFHATIPDEAAIYGLPYRYFEERGYKRTGFHGNSHAYVAGKAAEYLNRPIEELRIITCHLGNGCSLAAVEYGKSIDTTLGMTATSGLIMGTRAGDVDCGLIPIIMKEDGLSPDDMTNLLAKESGIAGISGVGRDMRDVEAAAAAGNERAVLAVDAFCYQVKRAMGSMLAVLGGCDCLVFCGGIGANSATVRTKTLLGTSRLGFVLDPEANAAGRPTAADPVADLSAAESRVTILAVFTFEELMMARQCLRVMDGAA